MTLRRTTLAHYRRARQRRKRLSVAWFNWVYTHHLIYNACWEDPRLDRIALNVGAHDTILTITSAGCNALDYALLEPRQIYAVDLNYRQNALLELKLAAIKHLDFDHFFAMFGQGTLRDYPAVYRNYLRPALIPVARAYWDRHMDYFSGRGWQRTFYFHGTSGVFACCLSTYINHVVKRRTAIEALFNAESIEEQCTIYHRELHPTFWKRYFRWLIGQDMTLSLLGVPPPQRHQVERDYPGGIVQFMQDCMEAVCTRLSLRDNYFWQVYVRGAYTPACCPEYLKPENFARLKAGLVNRISIHTSSLTHFLETHDIPISRVILLDHMDWLSTFDYPALQREWQAIVRRAAPHTRILWRSGGLRVEYVDPLEVTVAGRRCQIGELLTYDHTLAAQLHAQDRVHTYGSFYIADLQAA